MDPGLTHIWGFRRTNRSRILKRAPGQRLLRFPAIWPNRPELSPGFAAILQWTNGRRRLVVEPQTMRPAKYSSRTSGFFRCPCFLYSLARVTLGPHPALRIADPFPRFPTSHEGRATCSRRTALAPATYVALDRRPSQSKNQKREAPNSNFGHRTLDFEPFPNPALDRFLLLRQPPTHLLTPHPAS
jgi:hypothetical protein